MTDMDNKFSDKKGAEGEDAENKDEGKNPE
jgi:hypothetical protein